MGGYATTGHRLRERSYRYVHAIPALDFLPRVGCAGGEYGHDEVGGDGHRYPYYVRTATGSASTACTTTTGIRTTTTGIRICVLNLVTDARPCTLYGTRAYVVL